ncbi:MAG: aldo/keto reductase, partial [Vicinamibacterales bacterium]
QLCAHEQVGCLPYYGLARGFLTGKYRTWTKVDSPRASGAQAYLNDRGLRVLAVLDEIAADRQTTVAAVALAWLAGRPTVVAPIASARSLAQLEELLPMATMQLSLAEQARLEAASTEPS